jgi:hypothetical protein
VAARNLIFRFFLKFSFWNEYIQSKYIKVLQ